MSTTGLNLGDLDIDPALMQQYAGATTGSTLMDTEVIGADDGKTTTTDDSAVTAINADTSGTSLLGDTSSTDGSVITDSDTNVVINGDTNIDVTSVAPDFTMDADWRSENISFTDDNAEWSQNDDGSFTQKITTTEGEDGSTDAFYNWSSDGEYLGLADADSSFFGDKDLKNPVEGVPVVNSDSIVGEITLNDGNTSTAFDSDGDGVYDTYRVIDADGISEDLSYNDYVTKYGDSAEVLGIPTPEQLIAYYDGINNVSYDETTGDFTLTNADGSTEVINNIDQSGKFGNSIADTSTVNTDPIALDSGNFAYGFDSNGDGEIDTYRITDASGEELTTIDAEDYTGTDYVVPTEGETITTTVVTADTQSTDGSYTGIAQGLKDDNPWYTGSTDEDGDGIPDGILHTGLLASQVEEHTFEDGSKGFIFSTVIQGGGTNPFFTKDIPFSMYWNEDGQLVGKDNKGYEGMTIVSKSGADDGADGGDDGKDTKGDGDDDADTESEEFVTIKTALTDLLVTTDSDITDDFVTLWGEISGLFDTDGDGILTADDEQQLLGFFNTMLSQGGETGVILSSKTMTDYFNLVKEYTGQYNGTISDADMDTFLADWLAESVLFTSGLDNSQKWSLDNITAHSNYNELVNLMELIYGEGRTITDIEAMRYLTNYSWKDDNKGWLYGIGGDGIRDNELGVTNYLVGQLILNAEGADQQNVYDLWLANSEIDLEAYGLTLEMIAESWGITVEELQINTEKAKKNNKKKSGGGSFFSPKDVVRIGDEDPGSSNTTVMGNRGRSRTKPSTLLGGGVQTSTLTGSN